MRDFVAKNNLKVILQSNPDLLEDFKQEEWLKLYAEYESYRRINYSQFLNRVAGLFECVYQLDKLLFYDMIDEIKVIPSYCFGINFDFTDFHVPEGVVEINSCAFGGCKELKNIVLPKSLQVINDNAFLYCEQLKELHIPENIMSIHTSAFRGLYLEHVYFPDKMPRLDESSLEPYIFDINNAPYLVVHTKNPIVTRYCKNYDIEVKAD